VARRRLEMIKIAHHTFVALKLFTAAYSLCSPLSLLIIFLSKENIL
jgi:hypothetical protein